METNITHKGIVLSVFGDTVTVAVETGEACASCASRAACSLGTQTTSRNVLINTPDAATYSKGEVVTVATKSRMGLTAVAFCYAVPAIVLVVSLAAAIAFGLGEGLAALISLGSLVVYYIILWLMQDKLARKISFTIHKE